MKKKPDSSINEIGIENGLSQTGGTKTKESELTEVLGSNLPNFKMCEKIYYKKEENGFLRVDIGIIDSYDTSTYLQKKGDDVFELGYVKWIHDYDVHEYDMLVGKIKGDEKEMLEVADYIDRLKQLREYPGVKTFVGSEIEGNEKEMLEVADFINRAKNIAKHLNVNGRIDGIDFELDKDTLEPKISFNFTTSEYEEIGQELEPDTQYAASKKILNSDIWESLPKNNIIKKNIIKILDLLNKSYERDQEIY